MKNTKNPLYEFISQQIYLIKKEFIVFAKTSLFNDNYYMLIPRNQDKSKIGSGAEAFAPADYHISVYEVSKKELAYSAVHLTANLIDKFKKKYTARIYYTEFGHYLFNTLHDEENNSVAIDSEHHLLSFGQKNTAAFLNIILKLQQDYAQQYSSLIKLLKEQSKSLGNADRLGSRTQTLLAYEQSLQSIISHIQSGTLFNHKHLPELQMHEDFLNVTRQQLRQQQKPENPSKEAIKTIKPAASNAVIQPVTKHNKNNINHNQARISELNQEIAHIKSSKKPRTASLVLQEYNLYSEKLKLLNTSGTKNSQKLKKISREHDEMAFIETITKEQKLQQEINSLVQVALTNERKYKEVTTEVLQGLLKRCSLPTSLILELVVQNNHFAILKHLVQIHNALNFQERSSNKGQYLLEIAYHRRHVDVFKFLLEQKASPDVYSGTTPLLFQACAEGRSQEIELLLEANADPLATNEDNFNSLGAIVMREDRRPISEHVELFLAYAPHTINKLQGQKLSTPLCYICQKGWEDVAKFLLSHGADPNIGRFDDITALGVCVYKNNFNLFKTIIEHSTFPVKKGLINALDIAILQHEPEVNDNSRFITEILHYSQSHNLEIELPSIADVEKRLEKCRVNSESIVNSLFFQPVRSDYSNDENEKQPNFLFK